MNRILVASLVLLLAFGAVPVAEAQGPATCRVTGPIGSMPAGHTPVPAGTPTSLHVTDGAKDLTFSGVTGATTFEFFVPRGSTGVDAGDLLNVTATHEGHLGTATRTLTTDCTSPASQPQAPSMTLEFPNRVPVATISFNPATAIDAGDQDDSILATVAITDPDGDALSGFSFTWLRDQGLGFQAQRSGSPSTATFQDTLQASETAPGDGWKLRVRADDSHGSPVIDDASFYVGSLGDLPTAHVVLRDPEGAALGAGAKIALVQDIILDATGSTDSGDILPATDAESLAVTWDTDNDGQPDSPYDVPGVDNRIVTGFQFAARGLHTVTAEVQDAYGFADKASASLWVNQLPTASLDALPDPLDGNAASVTSGVTLSDPDNQAGSDSPDDSLSYSYAWHALAGDCAGAATLLAQSGPVSESSVPALPGSSLPDKGSCLRLTVTPFDGLESGTPVQTTRVISNADPTLATPMLGPLPAATLDDLVVEFAPSDIDADELLCDVEWWVDEAAFTTETDLPCTQGASATLPSDETVAGQLWWAHVQVRDGDGGQTGTNSNSLVIDATAPVVEFALAGESGEPVRTAHDLLLTIGTITNPDGLALSCSVAWYQDAQGEDDLLQLETLDPCVPGSQASLGNAMTKQGTILATVQPTNGNLVEHGLAIANTPPSASVQLPQDVDRTMAASATVALQDDDHDEGTESAPVFSYEWRAADSDCQSNLQILDASDGDVSSVADLAASLVPSKGRCLILAVVPNDGTASGVEASEALLVSNALPTVAVELGPSHPQAGDELVATLTPFDADGDDLTCEVKWFLDETPQSGYDETVPDCVQGSAPSLPATAHSAGESWAVQVTVFDGTGSTGDSDGPLTIGNTAPAIGTITLLPLQPGTQADLTASVTVVDPDVADVVACTFEWLRDDEETPQATQSLVACDAGLLDEALTTKGEIWTVRVTPNDGGDGSPAEAAVEIVNSPPVVSIGPNVVTAVGSSVQLTGSVSDADDDGFTFGWTASNGAPALSSATSLTPTLSALAGTFTYTLTADDGHGEVGQSVTVTGVPDTDGDGRLDNSDNCLATVNPDQSNVDGDALGDACDNDRDGDGTANASDNCPNQSNGDQADGDGDGIGTACDPNPTDGPTGDADGDGRPKNTDNCPSVANGDQVDSDGDGAGDVCDAAPQDGPQGDSDADGVRNNVDNCPAAANANQANGDGDALGDACDANLQDGPQGDADGDGVRNNADNCLSVPNANQANDDGDTLGNACDGNNLDGPQGDLDGDGVVNGNDAFPRDPSRTAADPTAQPVPDSLLLMIEGASGLNLATVNLLDANGDGIPDGLEDPDDQLRTIRAFPSQETLLVQVEGTDRLVVVLTDESNSGAFVTRPQPGTLERSVFDAASGSLEVTITIPDKEGWILVSLPDPNPEFSISGVRASDGRIIPMGYVWREGGRLNFLDDASFAYVLEYEASAQTAGAGGVESVDAGGLSWPTLLGVVAVGLAVVAVAVVVIVRSRRS